MENMLVIEISKIHEANTIIGYALESLKALPKDYAAFVIEQCPSRELGNFLRIQLAETK